MLNKDNAKPKSMRQIFYILGIIAAGTLLSIAYASTTILTDTYVSSDNIFATNATITNLDVSSCSGCGGGSGLQNSTVTVTSSDVVNSTVLHLTGVKRFIAVYNSDGSFATGDVILQAKKTYGTWRDTPIEASNTNNHWMIDETADIQGNGWQSTFSPFVSYPFELRVQVNTALTAGSATFTVIHQD